MTNESDNTALIRRVSQLASAPQRTARLLFFSDATPDSHVGGVQFNIRTSEDLSVETFRAERDDPSTIYVKAEIANISGMPRKIGYYPAYHRMTPRQRANYLHWLCDITQAIPVGYVFVYYYGLERHLVLGDFDGAVEEILTLRRYHRNRSFERYSASALMHACLIRNRIDVLEKLYELPDYNFFDNTNLLLLHQCGAGLNIEVLTQLCGRIHGVNRRYLERESAAYAAALKDLLREHFASDEYPLAQRFPLQHVEKINHVLFSNVSLPSEIRSPPLPDLLHHPTFQKELRDFYDRAHNRVKSYKGRQVHRALSEPPKRFG